MRRSSFTAREMRPTRISLRPFGHTSPFKLEGSNLWPNPSFFRPIGQDTSTTVCKIKTPDAPKKGNGAKKEEVGGGAGGRMVCVCVMLTAARRCFCHKTCTTTMAVGWLGFTSRLQ